MALGMDSGDLSRAVADAVAAMDWITPADQAAVDLALTYADAMDKARAAETARCAAVEDAIGSGDEDRIKAARAFQSSHAQDYTKALYLGPHLLSTLSQLGGTPAGRKAMTGPVAPVRNRLDEMRARREGKPA